LTLFFIAYFVYYSPYYALFPDLVPREEYGRSQGVQGGFRSVGMLLSLVGGGLLLHLWEPLPFLIAATAIVATTLVLFLSVRDKIRQESEPGPEQINWTADLHLLCENRNIRLWMIANSLWEASIAALRAFIVLYFTRGLGLSLTGVSGALALVGGAAVVAAPLSGKLGDRYGHRPVMLVALWGFGLGLLPPLFTTNHYFIAGIVPVAFAAVVLMTLPYSVLMGLLPEEGHHGSGAAMFGFSRGVGVLVGPLLTGLAVELLKPVGLLVFDETQGYAAMFGVASALLLVSVPVLRRMKVDEGHSQSVET
jgi:MFS family permease